MRNATCLSYFLITKNLKQETKLDKQLSSQYDKTDQLKQAFYNEGKRVVDYQWDKVGNRIQVNDSWLAQPTTFQVNSLNQYTSINQQAPSYDANGNLTQQNGITYSYDSQNRLISANSANSAVKCFYDARNRVIKREINGEAIYLIYDNWNLIAEYNSKAQLIASYIHGANIDELISKTENGSTVYYHQDALGNVIHLTNAKGQIVESHQYDAFGEPTIYNAQGQELSASAFGNRFLFTGREWIKELGLYDYRNRVYSPELGRFLSTDPIDFDAGDMNLYRYVENNPINETDPEGLMAGAAAAGAGAIAIDAVAGTGVTLWLLEMAAKRATKYWCKVRCYVVPVPPNCVCNPSVIESSARGPSRSMACKIAEAKARSSTPRGCRTRHCHTVSSGQR